MCPSWIVTSDMAPYVFETTLNPLATQLPRALVSSIARIAPKPSHQCAAMIKNLHFWYEPTYPGGLDRLVVRDQPGRRLQFDYNQWDAILERRRVRDLALERAMRLKRNPFRRLPSEIVKDIWMMTSIKTRPPEPHALLMKDVVRLEGARDCYADITIRLAPHVKGLVYFRRCVWRPGTRQHTGRPVWMKARRLYIRERSERFYTLYRMMLPHWGRVLDDLQSDQHEFRTPQEEVEFHNLYERAHAEREWARNQELTLWMTDD